MIDSGEKIEGASKDSVREQGTTGQLRAKHTMWALTGVTHARKSMRGCEKQEDGQVCSRNRERKTAL